MPGTALSRSLGAPRVGTPRSDLPTLGPNVGRFGRMLDVHFMPHQQHICDVALERTPANRWRYRYVVVHLQRRSGKSTMTFIRQVHRAITKRNSDLRYGAQSRREGLDIWNQQLREHLLTHAEDIGFKQRLSIGSEALRFDNGSEISLFTPSDLTGHGVSTDDVAIDEARFHSAARGAALEAALRPTQATRDGQLWIISSAGIYGQSDWLHSWLDKGREALTNPDSNIAFFDYSIPEDADPMDIDVVAEHHPAVGRTITKEYLAAEMESMEPYDYAREYGGLWTKNVEQVIPGHRWADCANPRRPKPTKGNLTLAFATSPTRSTSSIGAAWRDSQGLLHVALLDHRPGVDWLHPRLLELRETWQPKGIVFNAVGPAVSVADGLRRERVKLMSANSPDYCIACGALFEHILAGTVSHHAQPSLDDAVAGVGKRTLGERWVWGYKASEASISPLEAVTLAAWGYDHRPPRRTPVVVTA